MVKKGSILRPIHGRENKNNIWVKVHLWYAINVDLFALELKTVVSNKVKISFEVNFEANHMDYVARFFLQLIEVSNVCFFSYSYNVVTQLL